MDKCMLISVFLAVWWHLGEGNSYRCSMVAVCGGSNVGCGGCHLRVSGSHCIIVYEDSGRLLHRQEGRWSHSTWPCCMQRRRVVAKQTVQEGCSFCVVELAGEFGRSKGFELGCGNVLLLLVPLFLKLPLALGWCSRSVDAIETDTEEDKEYNDNDDDEKDFVGGWTRHAAGPEIV